MRQCKSWLAIATTSAKFQHPLLSCEGCASTHSMQLWLGMLITCHSSQTV
jgi:hypothetical protein